MAADTPIQIQLARAYLFAQGEIETYATDPPATAYTNAMELMREWKGHPAIWRAHNKLIKRGKIQSLADFLTLVTHGGDRPLQAFGPLFTEPKWAAFATAVGEAGHRVPPDLLARLQPMGSSRRLQPKQNRHRKLTRTTTTPRIIIRSRSGRACRLW